MESLGATGYYTTIPLIFPIISIIPLVSDILAIVVLRKCIRLSRQLKILTQNLVFCDLMLHVMFIIGFTIIAQYEGGRRQFALNILIMSLACDVFLYFLLVFALAIERLVSVRFPNAYYRLLSPSRVIRLAACIYIAGILVVGTLVIYVISQCQADTQSCFEDTADVLYIPRIIITSIFVCSDITIIFVSVYTIKVARQHAQRLHSQYPSTRLNTKVPAVRVLIHIGIFTLSFSFVLILNMLMEVYDGYFSFRSKLRLLTYIWITVNSFLSLYNYVFSLKECRLILQRFFCLWTDSKSDDYHRKRIEIYNIPTIRDL